MSFITYLDYSVQSIQSTSHSDSTTALCTPTPTLCNCGWMERWKTEFRYWILPEINICQSTEPWIWISFPKFGNCSTDCDYWGCIKGYPFITTPYYITWYSYWVTDRMTNDKCPAVSQSGWRATRCRSTTDAPITASGMGHCTVRAEKWLGLARGDWPLGRPNPGQAKIPLRPSITRPRSNLLV